MDIIARLKLSGQNFAAEFRKTLGDAERQAGSSGSVIGRNLGEGIGGGLQQAASRVPILGGALMGLSGTALVAAGGLGAVALAFSHGVAEAEGYEKAVRQIDAVLKATGNNTGIARDELIAFANDMEGAWAIPAEEIMKAEQVLASFDGVAGSVFKRAIEGAADMSAVFGGDLSGNTEKLGLVLQNLAQGEVTGLERGFKILGVQTLDNIKLLTQLGSTAEAQEALLGALHKRVGGSAEIAGGGLSGAFFRLTDAIGDATREAAVSTGVYASLVKYMDTLAMGAERVAARLGKTAPSMAETMRELNSRPGFTSMDDYVAQAAARQAYKEGEERRSREKAERSQKEAEAAAKRRANEADQAAKAEERRRVEMVNQEYRNWETLERKTRDALGTVDLGNTLDEITKQNEEIAEDYRRAMTAAVEDVADIMTGLIGGKAGRLVGDLFSLAGGGRAGNQALDFLFKGGWKALGGDGLAGADKVSGSVDKLVKKQEGLFGLSGEFTQTISRTLAAAGVGATAAGLVSSSKGAQFGGMAGGALGEKAGEMIGKQIGGMMGQLAGPLGSIAGGMLGGAIGSAFKKVKWGASTISFGDGGFEAGDAFGNSGKAKKAASASANGVVSSLESILEQLGGSVLSAPSITIGQRHGDYRVNTNGTSLKKIKGAQDFDDDQQAAIEYAVKQMLVGAVIEGISEASTRILKSDQDLDDAVRKAGLIEAIPKNLKARLDPVGAAIDALVAKWEKTVAALREGGASAEEMAQAQKLYNLELEDAKGSAASASAGLRNFQDNLDFGQTSSLGMGARADKAMEALQPYLDKIANGQSFDQGSYQEAAQRYLDIQRDRYGSTGGFYDAQAMIQAATSQAIATIDSAVPISGSAADPFAAKTATATQATADLVSQLSGQTQTMIDKTQTMIDRNAQILEALRSGGFNFLGGARNFG